MKHVKDKMTD